MEDRPQEDVRQPEVTYVTFPVYQGPDVKTLTHIKSFERLHSSSIRAALTPDNGRKKPPDCPENA
jgi:hypothetical protein